MSSIVIGNSILGGALQTLLMADEIVPGSDASYQLCKAIYSYHPLGRKMADSPITLAQSQKRSISIANGPEERIKEKFEQQWVTDAIDDYIAQLGSTARIYGIGGIVTVSKDLDPMTVIDPAKLPNLSLSFNVLDPLNMSGSFAMNQDPNSPDFQKHTTVTVAGTEYHRSRAIVLMHERPIYIEYSNSGFGYVGRSVYQRALYPLKSYVSTMRTDDMISRKNGLIVAKLKQAGSIVDSVMQRMAGVKRSILKEAETNNVLSISTEEEIATLDMQNVDGSGTFARTNIIKNIATAADMPAKMLENETMVSGFGEGSEDAKNHALYIDSIRKWLNPVYAYFDEITMRRAWTEEFYATIQNDFPEYKKIDFQTAFYRWKNSFKAVWPSLLEDPESEAETEDVRQKAVISMLEVLLPNLDPENKAKAISWAIDNAGENKLLFPQPLTIDSEALLDFLESQQEQSEQLAAGGMAGPDGQPMAPGGAAPPEPGQKSPGKAAGAVKPGSGGKPSPKQKPLSGGSQKPSEAKVEKPAKVPATAIGKP